MSEHAAFWTLVAASYHVQAWHSVIELVVDRNIWLYSVLLSVRIVTCCRDAQMKKEANVQRMAEKQKEAKLAVCTVLYKNS